MAFDFKNFGNNAATSDSICNLNKSKKLFFTGHEELSISADSNKKEAKVSEIAYNILYKYKNNPKMILKFMESKGTKIVYSKLLAPVLKVLGYDAGFIPKHSGAKAFILNFFVNLFTEKKIVLNSCMEDILITCKDNISLYFIAYQFHHWLSYKHKLPGYDSETMNLFRNTFNHENVNMSVLSINQILSLKDAIDRDKQAVEFVRKFVREQVGAKERLKSMLQGQAVKI